MRNNRRDFITNSVLLGTGIVAMSGGASKVFASTIGNESFQKLKDNIVRKFYKNIVFTIPDNTGPSKPLLYKSIEIFNRVFKEKTGISVQDNKTDALEIKLIVNPKSSPPESFKIEYSEGNNVSIFASDENGILYGIGKLLHSSTLNENGFRPGSLEGSSTPKKIFRAVYFATHFYNFYHVAPIEEVKRYIEDLALWGYNTLTMWFDMHHYDGIKDAEAQQMLDRLANLYKLAKSAGMKCYCAILANEGYKNSPENLRATKTGRSFYGVEICPSIEQGAELIVRQVKEEFSEYKRRGVVFDGISYGPYDQGGCGCDKCKPWGANGFVNISERVTNELRNDYPELEVILFTWLFDYGKDQGEWVGLAERFSKYPPKWVTYLMADSHTSYPKYPLEHQVPGNLPLLNFPEISMWEQWPWGGYGASPLPNRFQKLWGEVKNRVAGGFPYSEGIFEDINQVLYGQFYWHEDIDYKEALKEYIAYEYAGQYVEDILKVIEILEKNHGLKTSRWYANPDYGKIDVPKVDFGAKKAYLSLKSIDQKLPQRTRESWRWRILLIRSMLDYELRLTDGKISAAAEKGFQELFTMYHSGKGSGPDPVRVVPPINNGEIYRSGKNKEGLKGTD